MKFIEQQQLIQDWARERGIYQFSTPTAQALKAISEIGETCDAVIKGQPDNVKDGVGDTAVCLINLARMVNIEITGIQVDANPPEAPHQIASCAAFFVASVALHTSSNAEASRDLLFASIVAAFTALDSLATSYGFTFSECLNAAWLEIKDRKGFLSPSGAFVKEGDA